MPSSPLQLRRTTSNASLHSNPPISRVTSTNSPTRGRLSRPSSQGTDTQSPMPVYFVPDDEEIPAPTSNPFEGRLFDTDDPSIEDDPVETDLLDEVNFNSPKIGTGRGAGAGQFIFHDNDDDNEEGRESMQHSRYTTVQVTEDHGLEEDDEFLDEKRKVQPSRFAVVNFPRKISRKVHDLHDRYPRSTKAGLIILISLVPLFIIAFIILVVIATAGYQSPVVYSTSALETSSLEAGAWGFKFTRAFNMTMVNRSPMTLAIESIDVDVDLARLPGVFKGNGSTVLDFSLGPRGDFTNFLLPIHFTYDTKSDTSGDTLEIFLRGCGLVVDSTGSGVTFDMTITGETKAFGMFRRGWAESGVGGTLQCDSFLKDAVRIMGQLRGTQLTG